MSTPAVDPALVTVKVTSAVPCRRTVGVTVNALVVNVVYDAKPERVQRWASYGVDHTKVSSTTGGTPWCGHATVVPVRVGLSVPPRHTSALTVTRPCAGTAPPT